MDGGSTDETFKILKKYAKHLNWVSQKDHGQTDAINTGIKRSKGEIVAYLNSDDLYLPGTLKTVGEFFQANQQAKWLTGEYQIIDEQGTLRDSFVTSYKRWMRQSPTFWKLSIANFIAQPSTFWRREVHQEVGLFDENLRYCMDYDFWLSLIQKYPLSVTPEEFSQFRIHAQSKGGSQYVQQFAEEHRVLLRYSKNPIVLSAHWLHAEAVVNAYRLMK